jgi:hypothetical protein
MNIAIAYSAGVRTPLPDEHFGIWHPEPPESLLTS